MSDLISRKMLLEEVQSFRCSITGLRYGKGVLAQAADEYRKSILQIVEDQPTAFDKEKVIEEMKKIGKRICVCVKCREDCENCEHGVLMKTLIGIVEKGGVE